MINEKIKWLYEHLESNNGFAKDEAIMALNIIKLQQEENNKLKSENSRLYQENIELKDGFFQKHYKEAESQELMSVKKAWEKARNDYIDLNAEWEGKYMTAKSDARKELTDKFLGILAWYETGFIETENWSARNTVVQIITELNKLTDEMEANNNEC